MPVRLVSALAVVALIVLSLPGHVLAGVVPPVAFDDAYAVDEDGVLTVAAPGVLSNDTDVELEPLSAVLVGDVASGTLALLSDGSFSYTPDPDFNGTDSFTYRASDGQLSLLSATVTISVAAVNDAPSFVPGPDVSVPGGEDSGTQTVAGWATAISEGAANESGQDLTFVLTPDDPSLFSSGPDIDPATGTLSFRPADEQNGSTTVTVVLVDVGGTANGGDDTSVAVTFIISIGAVADPPTALDDAVATSEDVVLAVAAPGVLGNDTDPDGDSLTAVLVSGPSAGTLTLDPDGSFSYTPDADFNGTDSFTYRASDGSLSSNTATVTITVGAVNDAPVAGDDGYATTEDVTLAVAAAGVLGDDTDIEGDALTAQLVSGPTDGLLTLDPDGSFSYTPDADFNGTDSFTYRASDGSDTSNTATVTITIDAVNDPPVAGADHATTDAGVAVLIDVLDDDSDVDGPQPLSVSSFDQPAHGQVVRVGGALRYEPEATYGGPDSFDYRVSDGLVEVEARVTFTVIPVPQAAPSPSMGPGADGPEPLASASPPAAGTAGPRPSAGPSPRPSPSPDPGAPDVPRSGPVGTPSRGDDESAGVLALGAPPGTPFGPVALDLFFATLTLDWFIPGLLLGVPGVALMLAVIAQLIGALAWLPAIRRSLGTFGLRRRRYA